MFSTFWLYFCDLPWMMIATSMESLSCNVQNLYLMRFSLVWRCAFHFHLNLIKTQKLYFDTVFFLC